MAYNCKICSEETMMFAQARVLRKYDVMYFRCPRCGFVQTEEPFWLEEAYSSPITTSDIGLVRRNIKLSLIAAAVIGRFFNPDAEFIDYAGGYGLLVRLMRDAGFDFYRYDRFCENLFAYHFEADMESQKPYELLVAAEFLEHLVEPLDQIGQLFHLSENILFTTMLLPSSAPKPEEWWYYGLEHGQHVCLYTLESLQHIAKKYNSTLYTNGRDVHLFTRKAIPLVSFRAWTMLPMAALAFLLFHRRSLLHEDYFSITSRKLT